MNKNTIAVLGAGSWGTAVAIHLANHGNRVLLWGQNSAYIADMSQLRTNNRYLPSIPLPENLEPTNDLELCQKAQHIMIAVPSHAFQGLLEKLNKPKLGLSWLTKGITPGSNQLLSEVISKKWGKSFPVAIISGPSFATEVAKGLPTALTLAGNQSEYQQAIHQLLHHGNLRVYLSNDIIGVQLCGAVKNVLAIACGISHGMGYGANAQAALITRGLAEMSRLGLALGAKEETFTGLAGIGDLVLTCTDNQSRNRRFGNFLGQGTSIKDAEHLIGQVVEGKYNAAQVCQLAKEHQIDMPICGQINSLLLEEITPQEAVNYLMSRRVPLE